MEDEFVEPLFYFILIEELPHSAVIDSGATVQTGSHRIMKRKRGMSRKRGRQIRWR